MKIKLRSGFVAILFAFLATQTAYSQCADANWPTAPFPEVTAPPTIKNPAYKPGWHLIFNDEFSGTSLDPTLWKVFHGESGCDGTLPYCSYYFVDNKPENITVTPNNDGRCLLNVNYYPGHYPYPGDGQNTFPHNSFQHTGALIGTKEQFGPGTFWELRGKRNGEGYKSSVWSFDYGSPNSSKPACTTWYDGQCFSPTSHEGISLFDNAYNAPVEGRRNWFETFKVKPPGNPTGQPLPKSLNLVISSSLPNQNEADYTYSVDYSTSAVKFYLNNKIAAKEITNVPVSAHQEIELWAMPLYWDPAYKNNTVAYQAGGAFPNSTFSIDYFRAYKKNAEIQNNINDYCVAQSWTTQQTRPRLFGDFNGDGKKDIVGFGSTGVSVSLSTPSNKNIAFLPKVNVLSNQYNVESGWTNQDERPRLIGDVNGDGKDDIIGFGWQQTSVSLSTAVTGSTTPSFQAGTWVIQDFTVEQGWNNQSEKPRMMADVNGDGRSDIIGFSANGVWVSLSNRNDMIPGFAAAVQVITNFGTMYGWTNQSVAPRMLADVNGDGLPDIIGFGNGATFVARNTTGINGSVPSFAPVVSLITNYAVPQGWNNQEDRPRMMADVNGDGKADIVGFGYANTYVSLNTSTSLTSLSFATAVAVLPNFTIEQGYLSNSAYSRYVCDINNDGKADIVGMGNDMIEIAISKSVSTASFEASNNFIDEYVACKGWNASHNYPKFLTDVNGDGSLDLIGFSYAYVNSFQSIGGTYNLPMTITSSNKLKSNDWDISSVTDGADVAYKFYLRKPTAVTITTCFPETSFNAMVQIYNESETPQGPYFKPTYPCSGNSTTTACLPKGYYYAVVDGFNGATGNFKLSITASAIVCAPLPPDEVATSVKQETKNDTEINIYPNPSQGNFNIDAPTAFIGRKVYVYSMLGNLIKEFTLENSTTSVSGIADGLYLIKIDAPGQQITKKIIVNSGR